MHLPQKSAENCSENEKKRDRGVGGRDPGQAQTPP
jgi:hypothetical protein